MVENRNETANENQNEMTETEKMDPEELAEKTEAAAEAEASGENPPDEGAAPSGEPEQMVEIVGRLRAMSPLYDDFIKGVETVGGCENCPIR